MEKTYGTTRILVVLPFTTSYVFIKYQVKGPDSFPDPDGLIYLWEPTRCAKLFSEENLKKLFEIVGKRITGLSGDEKEVSALLILFSLSFLPQLPTINDILPQNIRSRCNSRQWIQISMGHPDS